MTPASRSPDLRAAPDGITREEVDLLYRALLGRAPENERAIRAGLAAGSVEALRRRLLDSPEFAARLRRDKPRLLRRWMLQEMQAPAVREKAAKAPPRLVVLHIMKTAGIALRLRLEALVAPERVWRREEHGLPGDATPEELASCRLVIGHFTMRDALAVPPPRRIVTLLRDPRDRLVSLHHYYARFRPEAIERLKLHEQRVARASTLAEFLRSPDERVRAVTRNAMTCALAGDYLHAGGDRYRAVFSPAHETISGAELLEKALANLRVMAFVGFVERLDEDVPKLMVALGLPDAGPLPRVNTRELESDVLEPRDPPVVTPEAAEELDRATELDRMLYRLARMQFG